MSIHKPENKEEWRRLLPHVRTAAAETGEVIAVLDHGGRQGLASGSNHDAALRALRRKLFGARRRSGERPWLKLCKPCNRRAVDMGERQYTEGVSLCAECAAAIDAYNKAIRDHHARRARNRRKVRRRRRR